MRLLRASLLYAFLGVFVPASLGASASAWASQPAPVQPARPAVAPIPAAPTNSTTSTTPAPSRDRQYAAREAKSPQAAKFKGGEGVGLYIGGSTVAVILFVVLLVVLL